MNEEKQEKLNDIWSSLKIWDKVEALECLGIKLNLTDEELIDIAGQKAAFEKKEELEEAKESKIRLHGYFGAINSGKSNQEALNILFNKK